MTYSPVLYEFAIQLSHVAWPDRKVTEKKMEAMQVVYGLTEEQKSLFQDALNHGWEAETLATRHQHTKEGTIPHIVVDRARDFLHDIVN